MTRRIKRPAAGQSPAGSGASAAGTSSRAHVAARRGHRRRPRLDRRHRVQVVVAVEGGARCRKPRCRSRNRGGRCGAAAGSDAARRRPRAPPVGPPEDGRRAHRRLLRIDPVGGKGRRHARGAFLLRGTLAGRKTVAVSGGKLEAAPPGATSLVVRGDGALVALAIGRAGKMHVTVYPAAWKPGDAPQTFERDASRECRVVPAFALYGDERCRCARPRPQCEAAAALDGALRARLRAGSPRSSGRSSRAASTRIT